MSRLFEPFRIGTLTLAKRIVVAPMCQYSAIEGAASDWHLMHLGMLAMSGAALLVLEATTVSANR
jgi:2,4-dienoyl-CoA reductase-like NADH-dependent reductase (Old Yellow Enzyme family)